MEVERRRPVKVSLVRRLSRLRFVCGNEHDLQGML